MQTWNVDYAQCRSCRFEKWPYYYVITTTHRRIVLPSYMSAMARQAGRRRAVQCLHVASSPPALAPGAASLLTAPRREPSFLLLSPITQSLHLYLPPKSEETLQCHCSLFAPHSLFWWAVPTTLTYFHTTETLIHAPSPRSRGNTTDSNGEASKSRGRRQAECSQVAPPPEGTEDADQSQRSFHCDVTSRDQRHGLSLQVHILDRQCQ